MRVGATRAVLARKAPFVRHHLGARELGRRVVAVAFDPAFGVREGIGKTERIAGGPRRTDRDPCHGLHAPGDDDVIDPRHHGLRREMDRLLRRTTRPIDGHTGYDIAQTGGQPACPRDVARQWSDRVDGAKDDVVVVFVRDPVTFDDRPDHVGAEVGRVNVAQRALAFSGRAPQCVDDECFYHERSPHFRT
jgi:hypothetical protein